MAEMFALVGLKGLGTLYVAQCCFYGCTPEGHTLGVSRSETSDVVVGQLTGIGRRGHLKIEVQLPQRPVGRPW